MVEEGTAPDFIIVDGAEGGTGAAPMEYADHVGTPLTEGLMTVHNALVGAGLRDRIKLGASGKVATGSDIVKRLAQGADYTNAARAMMMAVGCIQSQECHLNTCPVGVATQDPKRARALDVADKTERVRRYQQAAVEGGGADHGVDGDRRSEQLGPRHLMRRVDEHTTAVLRRALRVARAGRADQRRRARELGRRLERGERGLVRMTVAEHIVAALARQGVTTVWGVVGDALNPVTDAIRRHDGIDWIGVRHEEAGAFAASAQAQLTGTLAVCMGTVGPGSIHLLNGLYDAKKSHAPGARAVRAGAAGRARHGLLPGGRQRRAVRRRRGLPPHDHEPASSSRTCSSAPSRAR